MPDGLGVGLGASAFADNFIKSFLAVRGQKYQKQQAEKELQLSALSKYLQDETITGDQRTAIVEQMDKILGNNKQGMRLSDHLKDLNNQQIETGETTTTTQDVAGNVKSKTPDQFGNFDPIPPSTSLVDKVTKRRGDVSNLELRSYLQSKQKQTDDDRDFFNLQRRIELEDRLLKSRNYQKAFEGYDEEGNLIVTWENPTDPTAQQIKRNYGKIKLASTVNKQISGNGLPKSVQTIATSLLDEINPDTGKNFTQEEALSKATDMYRFGFQQGQTNTGLGITTKQQQTEGIQPIQPKEARQINREDENDARQIMKDYASDVGEATTSRLQAEKIQREQIDPLNTEITDLEIRLNALADEDPSDADKKEVTKELNEKKSKRTNLINEKNDLYGKESAAYERMQSHVMAAKTPRFRNRFIIDETNPKKPKLILNKNYKENTQPNPEGTEQNPYDATQTVEEFINSLASMPEENKKSLLAQPREKLISYIQNKFGIRVK